MCGRYSLTETAQVAEHYQVSRCASFVRPTLSIAVGNFAPVIADLGEGRDFHSMRWGLVGRSVSDPNAAGSLPFASCENLHERPRLLSALENRRCLIPADGFFEWSGPNGSGVPYYIRLRDRQLFSFAGLWETWRGSNGVNTLTFSIISTWPNELMLYLRERGELDVSASKGIDDAGKTPRMPVILSRQDEESWLNPSTTLEALFWMLGPYPSDEMEALKIKWDQNLFSEGNCNVSAVDEPVRLASDDPTDLILDLLKPKHDSSKRVRRLRAHSAPERE